MAAIIQLIQVAVLGPSLFFVGYQVLLQRRQARNHVAVEGYKLYHQLAQQYIALLIRSDSDPALNCIGEAVDEKRRRVLDKAQRSRTWGAWYKMNPAEQRCYRLVRSALETFEQTYQLHQKGWIDDETWAKWQSWLDVWWNVRYLEYVLADVRSRLVKSFVMELDLRYDKKASPSSATPTSPGRPTPSLAPRPTPSPSAPPHRCWRTPTAWLPW